MQPFAILDSENPYPLRVIVGGPPGAQADSFRAAVQECGHTVQSADVISELLVRVLRSDFDIVVCFLEDAQLARDLSWWFAARRPSTQLALCCRTEQIASFQSALIDAPAVCLWADLSLDEQIASLESLGPRRGLVGRYLEIELVDYVQIVTINSGTKLIRVETRNGSGYIWFESGSIVHAEFGGLRAEEAVYAMLSGDAGSYCEMPYCEPENRSISNSNTHLLMEASRRQDEGIAPSGEIADHPLDAGRYAAIYGLEVSDSPIAELLVEEEQYEELLSANDIELFSGDELDFAIGDAGDFVSHCNAKHGVIQARALAFHPTRQEQSRGHRDELYRWANDLLPQFSRAQMPLQSAVCHRVGQTHLVGIVVEQSLVAIQLIGSEDPRAFCQELIQTLGRRG